MPRGVVYLWRDPRFTLRGAVKITESTKYVVKDRVNHRAITNGASRTNAHAVRRHLGDRFYVFNRITKRESR